MPTWMTCTFQPKPTLCAHSNGTLARGTAPCSSPPSLLTWTASHFSVCEHRPNGNETIMIRTGYSFNLAVGHVRDVVDRVREIGWTVAPIADRASTYAFV